MLSGKAALVTGSTSGIGLGIARTLAADGADILLNGFGAPVLIDQLLAEFKSQYRVKAAYSPADMSKPADVAAMIAQAARELGGVDILVNNAGIQHVAPVDEFPGRELGCGHRNQPLGRLSRHPRGPTAHEGAQLGTDHQHRLDPWPGGVSTEGGLRRGEAWHPRADEGRRARNRPHRHHLQCDLPRLGADAARAEADRRYRWPGEAGSRCSKDEATRREATLARVRDAGADRRGGVFLCSQAAAQIRGIALPVDGGWTAQ